MSSLDSWNASESGWAPTHSSRPTPTSSPSPWTQRHDIPARPASALGTRSATTPTFQVSTYTLHPSFDSPTNLVGTILLVASDQSAFYTSLSELSQRSSFFADLSCMNLKNDQNSDITILHLDDTPADSIRLLLTRLHRETSMDWIDELIEAESGAKLIQALRGLYILADKYDFEDIPQLLARRFEDLPFTLFAIATITEDTQIANIVSHKLLTTLDPLTMPRNIYVMLETHNPAVLANLFRLQINRERWRHHLELLLKCDQPFSDGYNGFSKNCKPGVGGSKRNACKTYVKYEGRFDQARTAAANSVMGRLKVCSVREIKMFRRVHTAILREVECKVCGNRMIRMVRKAVEAMHKQGWDTEEDMGNAGDSGGSRPQGYLDWIHIQLSLEGQLGGLSLDAPMAAQVREDPVAGTKSLIAQAEDISVVRQPSPWSIEGTAEKTVFADGW